MTLSAEHKQYAKQGGFTAAFLAGAMFVVQLLSPYLPGHNANAGSDKVVLTTLEQESALLTQLTITLNQRSLVFENMTKELEVMNKTLSTIEREGITQEDWRRVEKTMSEFARKTERWHDDIVREKKATHGGG